MEPKIGRRRSKHDLGPNLRRAGSALRKERVPGGDIWSLREVGEIDLSRDGVRKLARRERGAARQRIEVRMIQQIEDLKANLEAQPFRELGGFVEVKIPLPESGTAESIAATGSDRVGDRNGENRLKVRNTRDSRITELVNGFNSCAIRPLVNPVLASFVGTRAQ